MRTERLGPTCYLSCYPRVQGKGRQTHSNQTDPVTNPYYRTVSNDPLRSGTRPTSSWDGTSSRDPVQRCGSYVEEPGSHPGDKTKHGLNLSISPVGIDTEGTESRVRGHTKSFDLI